MIGDTSFVVIAIVIMLRILVADDDGLLVFPEGFRKKGRMIMLALSGFAAIGLALDAAAALPGNSLGVRISAVYMGIVKVLVIGLAVIMILNARAYVKDRELRKKAREFEQDDRWKDLDRELEIDAQEYQQKKLKK